MNDYITMLGTGILTQLEKAGIRREDISDLFVTHAHTDHLLGCIP